MQTGWASSRAVILYEVLIIPRPEKSLGNSPLKSGVDVLASVSMRPTMPSSTHARLLRSNHGWSEDIDGFCHCPAMVAQVHLECARWGHGGSPWAMHLKKKNFLMVGVAVSGAMVHCCWWLRLKHPCQAWTLLDAHQHWGSQSSSYQTQSPGRQTQKSGLLGPLCSQCHWPDRLSCGWPHFKHALHVADLARHASQACWSHPQYIHFLVMRIVATAGNILSTVMMVSLVCSRLLLEVYIMGGAWPALPDEGLAFFPGFHLSTQLQGLLNFWLCSEAVLRSHRLPPQQQSCLWSTPLSGSQNCNILQSYTDLEWKSQ